MAAKQYTIRYCFSCQVYSYQHVFLVQWPTKKGRNHLQINRLAGNPTFPFMDYSYDGNLFHSDDSYTLGYGVTDKSSK